MQKIVALNMSWNEYKEIVDKATDSNVILAVTDGEWDYLCNTDFCCDTDEIHEMIGKYLEVKIISVIIDISNDGNCVVIVIE